MIRKKDIQEFTQDLRTIYQAPTLELAQIALEEVNRKWSKKYPRVMEKWLNNPYIFTYYKYPHSIRKAIYTTNWIERFNKELKRLIKSKEQFPNEEAAQKIIYYQVINYNDKWSQRALNGFKEAGEQLKEMFKERYQ